MFSRRNFLFSTSYDYFFDLLFIVRITPLVSTHRSFPNPLVSIDLPLSFSHRVIDLNLPNWVPKDNAIDPPITRLLSLDNISPRHHRLDCSITCSLAHFSSFCVPFTRFLTFFSPRTCLKSLFALFFSPR